METDHVCEQHVRRNRPSPPPLFGAASPASPVRGDPIERGKTGSMNVAYAKIRGAAARILRLLPATVGNAGYCFRIR